MDIVLISPVSPFAAPDGHRLAVLSDLTAILDNGLRAGVISFTYEDEQNDTPPSCENRAIPALNGGFARRFVRGLFKGEPPSAERLYSSSASRVIRRTLLEWKPPVVIIDDASVSGYVPLIRDVLPGAKVILRSHNVMHDVRIEQLQRTTGLTRPAVRYDCCRYLKLERDAARQCDGHWAITAADAKRMAQLYGRAASCLTVSVPVEKYATLGSEHGPSNGFVHVGTLDFRRRSELEAFLSGSWPRVLEADPAATLTLAGALWGRRVEARNVDYRGRVANDYEVYRLGRFALNFQSSTGGIKLKTLTSLAAGRTLLSTARGVEGLPLESGKHYWEIGQFLENQNLKDLLKYVRATQPVADAGRQYVAENHSRGFVAGQLRALLNEVC
jgi:hypothetical protein